MTKFISVLFFILTFGLKSLSQTSIPDTNLRNFLVQNYSSFIGKNQLLVDSLAAKFNGTLDCSGKNIASLAGLEKFISIAGLNCSSNQLTSVDQIKALTKLTYLDCFNNQLKQLPDFSKLVNLNYFKCAGNMIQTIPDLSNNVALNHFDCFDNVINRIPGLDKLVNLTDLNIYNNNIDSLPNLSKLTKLTQFQCYNNRLTALNGLSNLVSLTSLIAGNNPLKQLPDVSKLIKIQTLMFWSARLDTPPFTSSMKDLSMLDLNANNLTALPDLTNNKSLIELRCQDNQIDTIVGLKNLSQLQKLNIKGNLIRNINDIAASQNTLTDLAADYNQISSLPDFTKFRMLGTARVGNNKLTFEDLMQFLALPSLVDSSFNYSPQAEISIPFLLNEKEGDSFLMTLNIDKNISNNLYTWTQNDVKYLESKSDSLKILKLVLGDSGTYFCAITNPYFPNLILSTNMLRLSVHGCMDLSAVSITKEDVNCERGGKVTVNEASIQGGKKPYKYKLTSAVLGKIIFSERGNFTGLIEKKYQLDISDVNGCMSGMPVFLQGKDLEDCANKVIVVNGMGASADLFLEEPGFAKVFNKSGKEVYSFKTPGSWDGSIPDGELPPGLYVVEYNGKSFTVTLLK